MVRTYLHYCPLAIYLPACLPAHPPSYVHTALRLAPLLDMANYGVDQSNEPEPAGFGIFGGKGLRIVANKDYKEGEEVCMYVRAFVCLSVYRFEPSDGLMCHSLSLSLSSRFL